MKVSLLSPGGLRALALGSLLAVGSAVALTAWAAPHAGHGGSMAMDSPRHVGRMVERLLDGAQATDAQRAQVRQIVDAAAADLKAQRDAGRSLREQQLQLFTQPTVDANAVEQLRQKQLVQHEQASKRITQAMLEISRVLTPEQRAKLAERMKARADMMRRHHEERRALEPRS
ncbi:MAG TPA: Spy/CpxP family protein refolding chaperone [Methylibium sp.]|nr:Spy/CpxP family protein refolding chaperone [Methylibium sp.]